MHITYDLPVPIDGILETRQRLAGKIHKTGMPHSNYSSERCQGEIFLKSENMQCMGSFKTHGAFNKLCGLTATEKREGAVACPAGNHVQGVSLSCTMLGIDGKVVMPKGAPKSEVVATCDYSVEVVLHGDNFNDTLAKASDVIELEDHIFILSYDDPQVIAGQGAIGLEILEDLYDVGNVTVLIGGGGLTAGTATTIKPISPTIRIISAQPENVYGTVASWYTGEITSHRHAGILADGCGVARPGKLTYEIARQLVDDTVLVSEDNIRQSMVTLIQRNRVITEGAGALVRVALLSGKLDSYIQNHKTVSLISGGNIDLSWVS